LPHHSKERDQAEARFKKAQKATQDAKEARADYESEARTVREKTSAWMLSFTKANHQRTGYLSFFVRITSARM
jgi:hypothetical protein